jgi:hypothetical protein
MAKIKMANNDLQNTTQIIKYWATRTPLKIGSFLRLKSSTYIKHVISICIQLITNTVHLAVIVMEINRLSFIAKWQKRIVFTKLDTYVFLMQRTYKGCSRYAHENFRSTTSCVSKQGHHAHTQNISIYPYLEI